MMAIGMTTGILYLGSNTNIDEGINNLLDDTKTEWRPIASYPLSPLGDENVLGAGNSGILAVMCYEHGNTADLSTNDTDFDPDGGVDSAHIVYGYAHTAGFSEDLNHSVSWDLCVRVRVNYAHCGYDGDKFNEDRVRVYLNMTSSDWSDGQNEDGAIADGYVVAENTSGSGHIYIWAYWDDSGASGYAINSDGTVSIDDVILEAKY
jgi:hypothetical protein